LTEDFCEDFKATLQVTTNHNNRQLLWSTGDTTELVEIIKPGLYWVMATVGNCTVREELSIAKCVEDFYLPNAITPSNSDGTNDCFFISWRENTTIESFEIYIFNRYGGCVFHSNDPFFVWDGTYKGVLHGNTVYVYVIYYQMKGDKKHRKKGTITVL